ncbi:MAG: hypothetical protein ACYDAY_08555 [Candidatus Dormibacteria bacterium]
MRPSRFLVWLTVLLAGGVAASVPLPRPEVLDGICPGFSYHYLHPSPGQQGQPAGADQEVPLDPGGSRQTIVTTGDQMAHIALGTGAVPARAGAGAVRVTITPLDPPAPAPSGSKFTGNAYRFAMTYSDGTPFAGPLAIPAAIDLLSPPAGPDTAYHLGAGGWVASTPEPATCGLVQVVGTQLGVYVLAFHGSPKAPPVTQGLGTAVLAIAVLAGFGLYWLARRAIRATRD